MVDALDKSLSQGESADKKIVLNTSYGCPYCGSGSEKYSELFNHGTCVNCGSPLEQFSATLTEKGEQTIKGSVLLLYSKEDMTNTAKEIMEELGKNGVRAIDVHDIIEGSKTSVVSGNLSFVMGKTAAILIVPSKHLEDSPVIATCLNNAIIEKVEGSKKIIPIYTSENASVKVPFSLMNIVGVNWDGGASDRRGVVDRERALTSFQQMVVQNTSK